MKKTVLSTLLLLLIINAFTQIEGLTHEDLANELQPLKKEIQSLKKENRSLKTEINILNSNLSKVNRIIDSLKTLVIENNNIITQTTNELSNKIKQNEENSENKISHISRLLSKNSLFGIIGLIFAVLFSWLLYWLLSKRQKTNYTNIIQQLQNTKTSIEENLVKEFEKQIKLLEASLQLIEQQRKNTQNRTNQEVDHSLALKVANEINLIERNLSFMDSNVRGYRQLQRSVERLKENLHANGYEILELLGKVYHPGLPATITNSIPDENLEAGKEIISKVHIPAVRYNDMIIQSAQVEVNVGV